MAVVSDMSMEKLSPFFGSPWTITVKPLKSKFELKSLTALPLLLVTPQVPRSLLKTISNLASEKPLGYPSILIELVPLLAKDFVAATFCRLKISVPLTPFRSIPILWIALISFTNFVAREFTSVTVEPIKASADTSPASCPEEKCILVVPPLVSLRYALIFCILVSKEIVLNELPSKRFPALPNLPSDTETPPLP